MSGVQIAVGEGLTNFAAVLREAGHQVRDLGEADLGRVDLILLSGLDEDLLGDLRSRSRAPVLTAQGRTPAEVLDEVRSLPTR